MALEIPTTVTIYGSLKVNDRRVLDLSRGEAYLGCPFDDEDALLEHLGVNMLGAGCDLSSLDGWADLPDSAVEVSFDSTEADLHRSLASGELPDA